MQWMNFIMQVLILSFGVVISSQAVLPLLNYAGQLVFDIKAFKDNGIYKHALINRDGDIHRLLNL